MRAAVRRRLRTSKFDAIFVYSSSMAPYVSSENGFPKFLDFVDSDGSKWLQYAWAKSIPASWLYAYEGRKLMRFEKEMARLFDASIFVSSREATHLMDEEYRGKIHFIQNGIDLDYFTGIRTREPSNTVIFTGAMDYFPNVDAVSFFTREVFPLVKRRIPDARFVIVGSNPSGAVNALGGIPGVTVTGAVPDIRPYLVDARVAVVPLRISQGIQNKILEALAVGLPVVTTPNAAGGLQGVHELPVTVLEEPGPFADEVAKFLLDYTSTPQRIARTREVLAKHYDWSANLAKLDTLLPQSSG
jgi:sugar transferase (PEP-CTERM/EpsH1 system associated)